VRLGDARLGGVTLGEGDAARIRGEAELLAEPAAGSWPAEYLVWEMHGAPVYGLIYGKDTAD